ncbi:MAG TPA: TraB/GumN family protein [Steroidobacteraceae bacterium]|nr:TraB/GumN family protein [Steroidobacteraceae bacterium]
MQTREAGFNRRRMLQYLSAAAIGGAAFASRAESADRFPLWEISLDRGKVFLLGHTPPRANDWKDSRVEALLRGCGHLWNETNHRTSTNIQDLMQKYGIARGRALESGLDAGQRARLAAAAKAVSVPVESLAPYRPWLAAQVLENALFSASPFNKRNADQVLVAEAQSLSVPVSSEFTTLTDTTRWLAGLSPTAETQYLLYIVDEVLMGQERGQRIYAGWDNGNAAPATAWMSRMARNYPQLYRAMDVQRNQLWVPRVQTMLNANRPSMIVVGFYHLVGPDSLPVQLTTHGFRVRQV